jgi:CRISPR-associated endonuclease/helicase Cas3
MKLDADAFTEFFRETWSEAGSAMEPFPWQRALAAEVIEGDGWPGELCLPTGAGKTAVLDLALFHLAAQADRPPEERTAPRRIFYVIDRRLVVDETYERGRKLSQHLARCLGASDAPPVSREVARRLIRLGAVESGEPVMVSRMRGGIYREDAWAESPTQPTICISTVDQVGSRLLFRGYGVSDAMSPVHAGLVGNDSLFVLDEAHLSEPFRRTLARVKDYHSGKWAEKPLGAPFRVVSMSATISAEKSRWRDETTRRADGQDAVLGPRLSATKKARLPQPIKAGGEMTEKRLALADAIAQEAADLLPEENGTLPAVIGVVVNRVHTARVVFEQLRELDGADAILLTGRTRPLDRDALVSRWKPAMRAGRDRSATSGERPLFVVATQTVEVGADLDFDALVTELAPLDSLRQRFGRLDRFGELGETQAAVVTLHDYTLKTGSEEEPIYGTSLRATWRWLKKHKQGRGRSAYVDFGIDGLELPAADELEPMCAPRKRPPVLLPAHVDTLVQTDPQPDPAPEVGLYLHGPDSAPADVQVVWRADISVQMLQDADHAATCTDIVSIAPPTLQETLSLPIWSVKSWLQDRQNDLLGGEEGRPNHGAAEADEDLTDVEGVRFEHRSIRRPQRLQVLRWDGPEESEVIPFDRVRPGETIVVPSEIGGEDDFGFNPKSAKPVADPAERGMFQARRSPVLRLHPDIIAQWEVPEETAQRIMELLPREESDGEVEEMQWTAALESLAQSGGAIGSISAFIRHHASPGDTIRYPASVSGRTPLAIPSRRRPTRQQVEAVVENVPLAGTELSTEDDTSSSARTLVPLDQHVGSVENCAQEFAQTAGFDDATQQSVRFAGRFHDLGKCDPRFQTWLHGGDAVAAAAAMEPLAKSAMDPRDHARWNRSRALAGFPPGYRHECLSVAMLEANDVLADKQCDPDLVSFLIGSHHGKGRPLFPPGSDDPRPDQPQARYELGGAEFEHSTVHGLAQLDSGWAERFWRLIRRYGYWGLAYLEAILRLADHHASREEERADDHP